LIKDIHVGAFSSGIGEMIVFNDKLYFYARTDEEEGELWMTDGTTEGTELLKDINPTGSAYPRYYTVLNDKMLFSADNGTTGFELWITDGTTAGTLLLKDINSGEGSSISSDIFKYNDRLYFSADDGINNYELWVTDGTLGGTQLLGNINPTGSSWPHEFTIFNSKLYFIAIDGTNGEELWVTDGTAEGTEKLLPDIAPNSDPLAWSNPFIEFNDYLYFKANYTSVGSELWRLKGAVAGVADNAAKVEFKIYPNPTKAVLFVSLEDQEIENIRLFDLSGKEMTTISITGGNEINLLNLKSGTYLIQIETEEGTSTRRFVKMN
jgi:ELWxxDGT repeat protein